MSSPLQVSDKSFEREVIQAELPVLIDFWAPTCGPCRMIGPIVEELAEQYTDRLKVVKLDTQANPRVPTALGVRSIPLVVLFHGGEVRDMILGARPKVAYTKMIDRYLKKVDKRRRKEQRRQERASKALD
ncbi:MAG: thioredoxin [Deltaproteobacteria bacterium]|nr:thioredoxin [Deltaproteobacteria bacterium]